MRGRVRAFLRCEMRGSQLKNDAGYICCYHGSGSTFCCLCHPAASSNLAAFWGAAKLPCRYCRLSGRTGKNLAGYSGLRGGHFHLFATPKFFADPLGVHHSHLIAIELDGQGDLGGFFVPNIWVTDEAPKPSELLKSACQKFDARKDSPSQLISVWLAALTRTFLGDIVNLLEQRDRFLSAMPRQARKRYFADPAIPPIAISARWAQAGLMQFRSLPRAGPLQQPHWITVPKKPNFPARPPNDFQYDIRRNENE